MGSLDYELRDRQGKEVSRLESSSKAKAAEAMERLTAIAASAGAYGMVQAWALLSRDVAEKIPETGAAAWKVFDAAFEEKSDPKLARAARFSLLEDGLRTDRDDIFEMAGKRGWLEAVEPDGGRAFLWGRLESYDSGWTEKAFRKGAVKCGLAAARFAGAAGAEQWRSPKGFGGEPGTEEFAYEAEQAHPMLLLMDASGAGEGEVEELSKIWGFEPDGPWFRAGLAKMATEGSSLALAWASRTNVAPSEGGELAWESLCSSIERRLLPEAKESAKDKKARIAEGAALLDWATKFRADEPRFGSPESALQSYWAEKFAEALSKELVGRSWGEDFEFRLRLAKAGSEALASGSLFGRAVEAPSTASVEVGVKRISEALAEPGSARSKTDSEAAAQGEELCLSLASRLGGRPSTGAKKILKA